MQPTPVNDRTERSVGWPASGRTSSDEEKKWINERQKGRRIKVSARSQSSCSFIDKSDRRDPPTNEDRDDGILWQRMRQDRLENSLQMMITVFECDWRLTQVSFRKCMKMGGFSLLLTRRPSLMSSWQQIQPTPSICRMTYHDNIYMHVAAFCLLLRCITSLLRSLLIPNHFCLKCRFKFLFKRLNQKHAVHKWSPVKVGWRKVCEIWVNMLSENLRDLFLGAERSSTLSPTAGWLMGKKCNTRTIFWACYLSRGWNRIPVPGDDVLSLTIFDATDAKIEIKYLALLNATL